MSEIRRIEDQLRRAFEGEAWHGPALLTLLRTLTAAQAAARPLPGAHSIWEIVRHISVWEDVVRRRLEGEEITDLPPEQDWPLVPEPGEAAWKETRGELEARHRALRQAILGLEESRLGETVRGKNHSVYVMLHGVVQHDLYHAGQVALLRRALR